MYLLVSLHISVITTSASIIFSHSDTVDLRDGVKCQ